MRRIPPLPIRTIAFLLASFVALGAIALAGVPLFAHGAGHGSATAPAQSAPVTRLYWESQDGTQLLPLDSNTLAGLKGQPIITLGDPAYLGSTPQIITSADGSTVAAVYVRPGNGEVQGEKHTIVRIFDARTTRRRAQFSPAAPMTITGLSADGSQLYGTFVTNRNVWRTDYVINATSGQIVRKQASPHSLPCCGPTLNSVALNRQFELRTTLRHHLRSTHLLAFDLASGHLVGRLALDHLMAGTWRTKQQTADGYPVMALWEPGFALSPDGRQIAILDGQTNTLALIDAQTTRILRTESVSQPQSALARLGEWLGVVPAVAQAKGFDGMQLDMAYSPDGSLLYVTGLRGHVGAKGRAFWHGLGVRAIDVQTGTATLALPGKMSWWTALSPDAGTLYVLSPRSSNGCPCLLSRLDARTLQVTAQRTLGPDYYYNGSSPQLFLLDAPAR